MFNQVIIMFECDPANLIQKRKSIPVRFKSNFEMTSNYSIPSGEFSA